MKKLYSILPAMMALLMAASFSSCVNEDSDIAYTLEGTWRGDMRIWSDYRGYAYYATYTEITFLRDPGRWSSGAGYWVDYYSGAPWDYVANHIEWTVVNGEIRIYFREDDNYLYIRDYRLSNNRFYGTLYDAGQRVDFTLDHISSPNWNTYNRWGYDDWYYDDYYYSRQTRSNDSIAVEKPVRKIGNVQ